MSTSKATDPATNTRRQPREIALHPVHLLSFGLGSGLLPKAPGTFGTLAALPFVPLLASLGVPLYLFIVVLSFVLGIWLCGQTTRALGTHDHGAIVWDEWVGLWITLIAVPMNLYTLALGFVLFRFFDILKPWPIAWADRKVHGGLGIMLDDVLAGVMAWLLLQLALYLWPIL